VWWKRQEREEEASRAKKSEEKEIEKTGDTKVKERKRWYRRK
jgi:hypothetical protein